ncbi:alanine racemase [Paremcibacter congregatus]|uniref:Alanine racemase n=1 Tax=Paremcibacter congregatus TaxID=2043170 RepID=A0A2G4YUT6_9PROT|nr:alanine racemase [Paremcibacter congregatus]PHZ86085.1 alanine racemase [Paremcibacter congregatus]QDE27051.1 alanine racemase [Paremcibacter congregatus]
MTCEAFPSDCQATLTIDLDRIITNYRTCRSLAGGTDCAAMVKADAYGMGIEQVAPALYNKAGCRNFFVANLAEAIKLRRHVPDAIIYVLNGVFPGHVPYFIQHRIRPVLNDLDQIQLWAAVTAADRPACAIHFDSGINRLGLSPQETGAFIGDTTLQACLNIALIMSHLACSDAPEHPLNLTQLQNFTAITRHFPGIPASLANSGGILLGPDYHFDLARPGLMMFGGNPSPRPLPDGIQAAYHISGKVLQLRDLRIGETVGYGATWTAERPSRIAIINVGYADGYLQVFNNCGQTAYKGHMLPIVGRVSMDMIAVDITDLEVTEISPGDDVELLGEHITLEMASEVSTLSQYEILTGVKERYQRVYK